MARAISKVNGFGLEKYYSAPKTSSKDEDDQFNSSLSVMEQRLAIVKAMHGPIIEKLYDLYNILEASANESLSDISFDDIKNL